MTQQKRTEEGALPSVLTILNPVNIFPMLCPLNNGKITKFVKINKIVINQPALLISLLSNFAPSIPINLPINRLDNRNCNQENIINQNRAATQ